MNKLEKHGARGSEGRDGGIGRGHDGSKPTESMEQESWEVEFGKQFVNHGEFIYNRGSYPATCGEVKAFIHKVRREAYKSGVRDTVEEVKHMIEFRKGFYSHPKELARWLNTRLSHLSNLSLESKETT